MSSYLNDRKPGPEQVKLLSGDCTAAIWETHSTTYAGMHGRSERFLEHFDLMMNQSCSRASEHMLESSLCSVLRSMLVPAVPGP